jgi:hypothetical protein
MPQDFKPVLGTRLSAKNGSPRLHFAHSYALEQHKQRNAMHFVDKAQRTRS